jgi:hypothetical protein
MIRSGGDMKKNTEAQINAANLDLDAFSQGGPAIQAPTTITDRMHALLVTRADALEGCTEGSPEEAELASLADAIEAYEAVRWPSGKAPGGKG